MATSILFTLRGGIKKIIRNNYPFKYYNTGEIDKNFILSILPDKRLNRVLAGTSENGLLVFDTMQRLVKNIKTLPGGQELSSVNAIIKSPEGSYLLFEPGEK